MPKIKKIFDESGKLIDEINSDEKILDNAYSINNIIHTLELRGLSNQSILDILFAFAVEDKQCDIDYIALSSLIDGLLVMPSSYTIYGDIKELSTKNNLNDTNIKLLFYIYQLGIANDKKPTIQKKFEDNPNFKASLNILSKSKIFSKPNIERLDEKSAYISEGIIKALSALNEAEILDQLNFDRVISCCSQESLAKRYLDTYMAQRKVVHLEQNTFDILMLFASANITECEEVCGALGGKSINQDILKILSTLNLAGILPNLVSLILSELEFFDASLASIVTILKENGILTAKLFEYFLYKDLPSRKNILGVINKLSEFSLLEDFNLEEKLAAVFKEDSVWYGADITSSPFLLLKYFLGAGQLTLTNFERISDNFAFITSDLVDLFSILPDKVNFKAYFIKSFNLNKEVIDNIKNLVEPLSKADILHNVSFEFIKNKCNDSEFISAIHALCRNNCLTYEAFSRIANNNGLTKIVIGLDKAKLLNSDSFDKLFTLGENINFSLKLLLNKLIEKDSLTSKNYSYLINFSSVLTTSLSEVICRDIDNFFVQNSKASIIDFETFFAKAVPYEVLVELQDEILYVEAKKNEFKNWHASKRGGIDLLVQGNPNCSIKKNAHITHTESLVLKQIALAKENDKPEQLENHWLLAFVEVKRLFKEAKNSNGTWCSWFKGRKKETEEFYSEKDSKFSSVDVETMFNVGARLRA